MTSKKSRARKLTRTTEPTKQIQDRAERRQPFSISAEKQQNENLKRKMALKKRSPVALEV